LRIGHLVFGLDWRPSRKRVPDYFYFHPRAETDSLLFSRLSRFIAAI